MKNSEMPANPSWEFQNYGGGSGRHILTGGLNKREYACIHCGVPNTGDPELDAIITEGNRIQKAMIDPSFGDLN